MAETFILHFPDIVRVAGEVLQGHVELNVPLAMEDKVEKVSIKLRGSIVTKLTETKREFGPEGAESKTHYKTQTVQLLRMDTEIWNHFNSPQGVDVLVCPFQIQLPQNLPPSFHFSHHARTVAISYSIEVVGSRHGIFHANRRVRKIFSIVPAATPWELNASATMRQGWNGPWKPIGNNKQMRHGIFGDYSEAMMELVLPDLPSYPMFTGIPYSFHVVTKTKPVHHDDLDHKHGKLFPAPPTSPADIELDLHILGHLRAHGTTESMDEKFELKGSLGDKDAVSSVRVTSDEPEWTPLPDHKDKGSWKRAVHFEGLMTIPFAPTFTTDTAEWHYMLRFKIDFPGIGNDLELEFPIHLNSGAACPPPPTSPYNANVPYAYPLPSGPPPMLNLPPDYWSGKDHDWDDAQ
ncbi:hypothetical protein C8R47DRAFT_1214504 [Mycena vitilis]|nr:hypothetical protein C8R47DRAFT_1214504 [Mycena vitilis]